MMRAAVAEAWPAICSRFEGRCWWLYLDTKKLVTTGLGILLETVGEAQTLPWLRVPDGKPATQAEVAVEYRRVKGLTSLAKMGGFAYKPSAKLRLPEIEIDEALMETTARFWAGLQRVHPQIDQWPADAQLAAMDLIWQNGAGFTSVTRSGKFVWPNMRAAFNDQDWTRAAAAVPGSGARADFRKRLFRNAARVASLGLDRDVLWDKTKPVADPTVPAPTDTDEPTVEPPPATRPKPAHGSKSERIYITQYGTISPTKTPFLTTTRTLNMWLESVTLYHEAGGKTRPYVSQGGYNAGGKVSASKGTHDRDAIDTSIKDLTRAERRLWELCTWITGFAGWIRLKITNLWPDHWHGVPKGGQLSGSRADKTGAAGQVVQFESARTGLVGWGMYARIAQLNVQRWTWEDYLAGWGVSLSALQDAFAHRKTIEDVKDLQFALSRHIGDDIYADGDPGPKTRAALAKVGPLNQDTLSKLGLEVRA